MSFDPKEMTRARQTVVVTVHTDDERLEKFVDRLVATLPELSKRNFSMKRRRKTAKYSNRKSVRINGTKLIQEFLHVHQQQPGIWSAQIKYTRPYSPLLAMFTLLLLCFGVIPGILFYFATRETADAEYAKVLPALQRFSHLVKGLTSIPSPLPAPVGMRLENKLKELSALLASGQIDQAEYDKARAKALGIS